MHWYQLNIAGTNLTLGLRIDIGGFSLDLHFFKFSAELK